MVPSKPIQSATLKSATPAADAALLGTEWAVIRQPTAAERITLGIARSRVAQALVLRMCRDINVMVIWQDKRRPWFGDGGTRADVKISRIVERERFAVSQARSVLALVAAGVSDPAGIGKLPGARPPGAPCEDCTCIWAQTGPFVPGSEQAHALSALALREDHTVRRVAA